ncbi:MAG: HmuY family protein [Microscillaceae bacterium]|jgi:hypothetical protein|nr:HmuY family protein [Microscillaceae bacterium]
MKYIFHICFLQLGLLWGVQNLLAQSEIKVFKNLAANDPAKKICFSFSENDIVSEEENWDIAFSKTSIYVNGSFATVEKKFEEVQAIADNWQFNAGNEGKKPIIKEWYVYDPSIHLVQALAGKTFVIKSANGKQLTKLRIISYYKNAPEFPEPGKDPSAVFTFEYVVAKNNKGF